MAFTYQSSIIDFGEGDKVKATGIFNEPIGTVSISMIEKVSGPSKQQPAGPGVLTLSIEQVATLITIGGAGVGVAGWMARTTSTRRRKKILYKKLMNEIDGIYSRFKMNARRCEAELHRLRDEVLDEFKEGTIDEDNYNTLDNRIEDYMKEIIEQIEKEKS